jgi:putative pyruvate formate lyase activating enzyme
MQGAALHGLIIRHLVLPGDVSGTEETLKWIRDNLSLNVTLSIMSQYSPLHKANNYKEINRAISQEEYNRALDLAWDLGFENVYIQEFESPESGIPDFRLDNPFNWCER